MNAEFTPSLNAVEHVANFRHWCQKVLPLVYDDSLSYYELLCKMTTYLNEVINNCNLVGEDVEELHNAYTQLQGYVNDYFGNVDFQELTNEKLDVMASDGSLSALIQPLFDVYKGEINGEISLLTARVNNIASLPEGSTTGDAELIDIRVGADGIVYESAGESVRTQVGDLKKSLNIVLKGNVIIADIIQGTYNAYGDYSENSKRIRTNGFIPVAKGSVIRFVKGNNVSNMSVGFFDSTKKYLFETQWFDTDKDVLVENDGYIIIVFKNGSDSDITVTDYDATTELLTLDLTNYFTASELHVNNSYGYLTWDSCAINRNIHKNRAIYGFISVNKGSAVYVNCLGEIPCVGFCCFLYDKNGNYIKEVGSVNNKLPITIDVDGFALIYVLTNLDDVSTKLDVLAKQVLIKTAKNNQGVFSKYPVPFEFGTFGIGCVPSGNSPTRLRTSEFVRVGKGTRVYVPNVNLYFLVEIFDSLKCGHVSESDRINLAQYTVQEDCYIKLLLAKDTQEEFESTDEADVYIDYVKPSTTLPPLYYFENGYLNDKVNAINVHEADCSFNGDSFIFITDVHWKTNYKRSPLLLKYISENTCVNKVVFGGDAITSAETKEMAKADYREFRKQYERFFGANWIPVIGNHELNNPGMSSSLMGVTLSSKEAYNLVSKEVEPFINVIDEYSYFVDNKTAKIRYFIVGSSYTSEITIATQNNVIRELDNTPSGYAIVVFSHAGIKLTGEVDYTLKSIVDKLDELQTRDDVDVICVFSGHRHLDGNLVTNGGTNVIATTCDTPTEETGSVLTRTKGTITEQAFDVVQIDRLNKKIYLTRIGAGSDRVIEY